jgi:hypothetical protein
MVMMNEQERSLPGEKMYFDNYIPIIECFGGISSPDIELQ